MTEHHEHIEVRASSPWFKVSMRLGVSVPSNLTKHLRVFNLHDRAGPDVALNMIALFSLGASLGIVLWGAVCLSRGIH